MTWNWQQPDWPGFSRDQTLLRKAEEHFLIGSGMFVGTIKHLDAIDQERLTIEAISLEALTTSEIEGEILDRASVQSSVRKQLGVATDDRPVVAAEQGIAEMMVDLYLSFAEPLSDEKLFRWHQMLVKGRKDLKDLGRYRRSDEAMQVVSGAPYAPKVHFEAPPSARVPEEMTQFLVWFKPHSSRRRRPSTRFDESRDCTFVLRVHSSFRGWQRTYRPCYF